VSQFLLKGFSPLRDYLTLTRACRANDLLYASRQDPSCDENVEVRTDLVRYRAAHCRE
jgi:hypothetical protein